MKKFMKLCKEENQVYQMLNDQLQKDHQTLHERIHLLETEVDCLKNQQTIDQAQI